MLELRTYQADALAAIRESVGQGIRRLICQAPTGAGKTMLAAAIVEGALRKRNRLAFVVSSISLIDQTVEMFCREGIRDVGVIQANHQATDWSKPIQVCSIQTLRARKAYPEAKVVIIDECHNLHKEHIAWLSHPDWQNVPFIGLSATPWTKGLGRYFESLLVMSTTKELIEQGHLAKFRVFGADHPDLSKVKTVAGDYHEGQLSTVMQDNALTANIVETWKNRWGQEEGRGKTLCFAVDRAHAKMLQERFLDAGISAAYQDANTTPVERTAIKNGFHDGTYKVVVNIGTLTVGIDWDVRCLILARPTKSEMLFVQIIGRALRTAEGKEHALILDHTDTTSRLGFVTDIHHDTLSMGKIDENEKVIRKPPLPKPCPKCTCLIAVGVKICPNCGFERQIQSNIFEKDGELVELLPSTPGRKKGKTSGKLFPYTMPEKERFYAQLKAYGIIHGRKEGWAAWSFREKFGVWPDYSIKYTRPAKPGAEVLQWIRSRNIAYVKRLAAEKSAARTGASALRD